MYFTYFLALKGIMSIASRLLFYLIHNYALILVCLVRIIYRMDYIVGMTWRATQMTTQLRFLPDIAWFTSLCKLL